MTELFVYIVAIFVALYIAFVALQALKTYSPNLYEGLENKSTSSNSSTAPSISVTGVGAASQLYAQTVTTAISAMETELGMDAYADQYLSILGNLKILYKQRALKAALQTPTATDNTANLMPIYLYGQAIQNIDMLEDFIQGNKKKSMW